jgi:glycosyltransferase involved in cell wall biosynthesis
VPVPDLNVYVIIPSFNEGSRIVQVIKKIKDAGYENIIVVDDGSTDNSMELIRKFKPVILTHLVNRGSGAATETGLKYCREVVNAETVVMIDADTQHDADDISKLVEEHHRQNADITIGDRLMNNSTEIPFKNRLYNRIANLITSVFAGKIVRDSQSGFKVFNKNALHKIILEHERYEHCSEILIKAVEYKFKVIYVPIKIYYHPEIKDKGQHFFMGIRTFINLLHSVVFKNKLK